MTDLLNWIVANGRAVFIMWFVFVWGASKIIDAIRGK